MEMMVCFLIQRRFDCLRLGSLPLDTFDNTDVIILDRNPMDTVG
jgi:hypothetical protein